MKYTFKKSIEGALDLSEAGNKLSLSNALVGGSEAAFEQPDAGDIPGEKFCIKEVEQKAFELGTDNVFDEDILSLLQTGASDIVGIDIFAYYNEDGKVSVPIRFEVGLKLTTMGANVSMGSFTDFSLMNITDNKIEELSVKNVKVPTGKFANLVITVFSKNKNIA